jgi:hypothetical protein
MNVAAKARVPRIPPRIYRWGEALIHRRELQTWVQTWSVAVRRVWPGAPVADLEIARSHSGCPTMKRREELNFRERLYLGEVVRGLAVTTYRFWRNLILHSLHVVGLAKQTRAAVTTQYPEELKHYPDNYRGSHRLTLGRLTVAAPRASSVRHRSTATEFDDLGFEHLDPHVEKFRC